MNKKWTIKKVDGTPITVGIPDQLGIRQEHCVSKWLMTIDLDIWTVPEAFVLHLIANDMIEIFANLALCNVINDNDEIKWTGDDLHIDPYSIDTDTLTEMVADFFISLSQSVKKSIMTYQYVTAQRLTSKAIAVAAGIDSPKKSK